MYFWISFPGVCQFNSRTFVLAEGQDPGQSEKIINMSDTSNILISFEDCIKQYCYPVYEKLDKGLTYDYISEILKKINIDDIKVSELYYWKNGIKFDTSRYVNEFNFCSSGKMLPLEEAIVHYIYYVGDNLWKENYFPLFISNAGDFLLYDVDKNNKTYGMLLFYSPSLLIVEPKTAYDNLESFFETTITCYQKGIYKYNKSSNTLEVNQEREFEISIEKNPHSEYWREG